MANGGPPYSEYSPFQAQLHITRDNSPILCNNFDEHFRDFVSKCLIKDPKKEHQLFN